MRELSQEKQKVLYELNTLKRSNVGEAQARQIEQLQKQVGELTKETGSKTAEIETL